MRILVCEDEFSLSRAIIKILENNNYSADAVYNGADAVSYIESGNYDAAILDIMMPSINGLAVLKKIRSEGNQTPILILSARTEVDDKVNALDSGANDYLTKPFDAKELMARIRVITRKQFGTDSKLAMGNIILDRATYELSSPAGSFKLANREFQIMELLISNPGNVISSERFLEKIWGYDSDTELNVVWVYISYLRKKLAALNANIKIKASRNVGYCLEEEE